jgi:uncharacterized protein YfaT (DUF1175 family)
MTPQQQSRILRHQLEQERYQLKALLNFQQSEGFREWKVWVLNETYNATRLETLSIQPYTGQLPAAEVALQNEFFRHFKEGLLYSFTLVEQRLAQVEAQLEMLKEGS